MKWVLTRIVFPVAFVVLGIVLMLGLRALKPSADRTPPEQVVAKVTALSAELAEHRTTVHSTGTVTPNKQVSLTPEVAGRITWVSDDLLPGARLDKGATFARIDARPYQYVLRQRAASLRSAELDLQLERERGSIAEKEWELLDKEGEATELALRRPQLQTVEAAVDSARAAYEAAELDVSRTSLRAPFNAIVVSESLDEGQLVGTAAPVATLVGSDRMRVEVSMPVEALAWIAPGAVAQVVQDLGDVKVRREGVVLSVGGQLDASTRTATAVIAIDDPLGGDIPLLPGAFVDVTLLGATRMASQLPREAVLEGSLVWTVVDDKLAKKTVTIGWGDEDDVFVTSGIAQGDRVITSGLAQPLEGLPVQILGSGTGANGAGAAQ